MENIRDLSKRQLELQICLSQRRIDKISQVLQSGVQAPSDNNVDAETAEVISRLYNTSLSDADILCCIGILEMLMELEGLKPLLNLMKSQDYSMTLRQKASKAIAVIGGNYIEDDLRVLLSSQAQDLRELAKIALGKV